MSVTPHPIAFSLPEQSWDTPIIPLGETIKALSLCVMGTTSMDHSWQASVRGLLDPVRQAFAEHRAVTEGATGLYAAVIHDAPRLVNAVTGLVAEHHALDAAMAHLATVADETDAELLRQRAIEVIGGLSRHRQHDADLVYEAYTTDIGGE